MTELKSAQSTLEEGSVYLRLYPQVCGDQNRGARVQMSTRVEPTNTMSIKLVLFVG